MSKKNLFGTIGSGIGSLGRSPSVTPSAFPRDPFEGLKRDPDSGLTYDPSEEDRNRNGLADDLEGTGALEGLDLNGDGKLSPDELKGDDRDLDGKYDRDDFIGQCFCE